MKRKGGVAKPLCICMLFRPMLATVFCTEFKFATRVNLQYLDVPKYPKYDNTSEQTSTPIIHDIRLGLFRERCSGLACWFSFPLRRSIVNGAINTLGNLA